MHSRTIDPVRFPKDQWRHRIANVADVTSPPITEPTRVVSPLGEVLAVYDRLDAVLVNPLRTSLAKLPYREDKRTEGLPSRSMIFGYAPRNTIRADFCKASAITMQFPQVHAALCALLQQVQPSYQQWAPDTYATHLSTTQARIKPAWRLSDTPFTSGIVNSNNQLPYHHDTGNFKRVFSLMVVIRKGMAGGELVVPEWDLAFACDDASVMIFDGQSWWHGVAPFRKTFLTGYRYSIVYYTLEQLWTCLEPEEELARIRALKTTRTVKRRDNLVALEPYRTLKPQAPIFVPTRGRMRTAVSPGVLLQDGLTPTLVVEPQEASLYAQAWPSCPQLVLPVGDQGIAYARRAIKAEALRRGVPYYWQLDDNLEGFRWRVERQLLPATPSMVLGYVEQLVSRYARVALAGPDYQQFAVFPELEWTANTRVYACVLSNTAVPLSYRDEMSGKEDVDYCLQVLTEGWNTLLVHGVAMVKPKMGSQTVGGLSEWYRERGHEAVAQQLAATWPFHTEVVAKPMGLDVRVKWGHFTQELTEVAHDA